MAVGFGDAITSVLQHGLDGTLHGNSAKFTTWPAGPFRLLRVVPCEADANGNQRRSRIRRDDEQLRAPGFLLGPGRERTPTTRRRTSPALNRDHRPRSRWLECTAGTSIAWSGSTSVQRLHPLSYMTSKHPPVAIYVVVTGSRQHVITSTRPRHQRRTAYAGTGGRATTPARHRFGLRRQFLLPITLAADDTNPFASPHANRWDRIPPGRRRSPASRCEVGRLFPEWGTIDPRRDVELDFRR